MTKIVRLTENDLVNIIKKVISEQTPNRKRFIKYTTKNIDSIRSYYSKKYEELKSKGEATEDNEDFMVTYRAVKSLLYEEKQNNYVRNILDGQSQIQLWDEMLVDESGKYFAADIIKAVKTNTGRKYKYCRLGRGKEYNMLPSPSEGTPPGETCVKPDIDTINLPTNVSQTDFFKNNYWTLKESGMQEFYQTFVQPYKEYKTEIKKESEGYKMKACIDSMSFKASASRFRNMGQADDLTWEQLSTKRAQTVKDFLFYSYNQIGIQWCPGKDEKSISYDVKGSNGDGSSGPNPPKGYTFLPKGVSYNFNKFVPSGTKEEDRGQYGTPLTADAGGEKAYEQFRYVIPQVNIIVGYELDKPGQEKPTPEKIPAPQIVKSAVDKYWAALYTWRFSFGGGGGKGFLKKFKRKNKHGGVRTQQSTIDENDPWWCSRKSYEQQQKHYKKHGLDQLNPYR